MKRTVILLFLLTTIAGNFLSAEGIDALINKTKDYISDYFKTSKIEKVTIIKFENRSTLNDFAAQRFYQLLVSKMESDRNFVFRDLMTGFVDNEGKFYSARAVDLDYLIFVRLVQNKDKIGLGLSIFSKNLDQIIKVKYFEETVKGAEIDILKVRNYGFKPTGFNQINEIEVKPDLMDIGSIKESGNKGNKPEYILFYPQNIEFYSIEGNNLKKHSTINPAWERPYYPVKHFEGRLFYYTIDSGKYLIAATNFSPQGKVFHFTKGKWIEILKLNLVPFDILNINGTDFLIGGQYNAGTNYFKNSIILLPLTEKGFNSDKIYTKTLPSFYSITISKTDKILKNFFLIDRDYKCHFYASDFEEHLTMEGRRGAAMAVMDGKWLAVSSYTRHDDRLNFIDIKEGNLRPVYENKINGEIIFVRAGIWNELMGFWVYVKSRRKDFFDYKLTFWGKK